jgi:hypothetical protein
VHFLLQVQDLPDAAERQRFARQGIDLLNYVTGQTYIASARTSDLNNLPGLSSVRWAGPLDEDDKVSADLKAGNIGQWARVAGGSAVLAIQVHPDVSIGEAEALVTRLGGSIVESVPDVPSVAAIFHPGQAQRIAREDAVQFVDVVDAPLGPHNDGARAAANVNPLATAPYSLTGASVTVLVYDVGQVDGHNDFGARIIQNDGSAVADHATHVAGTLAGSGPNSNGNDSAGNPNGGAANQWAGVAPGVNIRSFGSTGNANDFYDGNGGDLNADFTTAINAGVDLATMSLGNNTTNCNLLGDYTNTAILVDNIVRGSISNQQLIYFESAGNERGTLGCNQFNSISSPATAKNSIVVGSINSNNNALSGFSSTGPTDDGRVRPDITAPGCQGGGDGGITSPSFIDLDPDGAGPMQPNGNLDAGETRQAYVVKCGTSMATPVSAGAGALLVQQWRTLFGAGTRPLPHTMKAILIHTATDRGNAGPDYSFGYGSLDAQAAIDLVRADGGDNDRIHVDQVDTNQTDVYTFASDGAANPRVTLVWSDPAATRLAATTLINDLDLRLVDPDGTAFQPFVLNAGSPNNAATTGNDNVNNVELVVGTAKAGTWEVRVAGTAVATGPQQYTLITPADAELNRPPTANAGGPYTTNEGTDVGLNGGGSSDPDGDALTYAWDLDDNGSFETNGQTPNFTGVGQDGVFTVWLRVTDSKGAFDVAQATVTVNNVAPGIKSLSSNAPRDENSAVEVSGTISDPGWLETLTATIDWGDDSAVENISGTLENVRPDATLTFKASHTYGDNGTFTARVCGKDDDTQTCQNISIKYDNVDPTATIDTSGATMINGVATFLAKIGVPLSVSGNSKDPGSDDLRTTWDFDDGTPVVTTTSLVNPPNPDPPLSPSTQPRNVTDTKSHTYTDACFYEISFKSVDDDNGDSPVVNANVIIVGNARAARSAGFWLTNYSGRGTRDFSTETLNCYLAIVRYMSLVFDEDRTLATITDARDVLFANQSGGDRHQSLDQQLLAAWLNFANGSIGLTEQVDTDGNGTPDTAFNVAVAKAETVRLNPSSTNAQLVAQKDILERINLRNGG